MGGHIRCTLFHRTEERNVQLCSSYSFWVPCGGSDSGFFFVFLLHENEPSGQPRIKNVPLALAQFSEQRKKLFTSNNYGIVENVDYLHY